jgi:titin
VIQQFASYGIRANSSGNIFEGNFIGTDQTGTVDQGNTISGIRLDGGASNNTVGGTTDNARNLLSGNGGNGIFIFQSSAGNVVEGNYIGTDVTGTIDLGNDLYGVEVEATSGSNIGGTTVGARNVISGNDGGVLFDTGGDANFVQNNYIGTDVTGTVDLGNTNYGVLINSAANNTIGGTVAGAANLISGNEYGVFISSSGSTGNQVQGNLIGTDVTGVTALGNDLDGVAIQQAPGNAVGGTTPEARNVISGNGRRGVFIFDPTASGNEILGNYIGTDVNGTADLGNTEIGVFIRSAPNNTIGGETVGAGNLISGNEYGVFIFLPDATGNQVQGNLIGTDVTGAIALGNDLDGVAIQQAPGNTVGGTAPEARNVISGNARRGIWILQPTASGNEILGNYIGTDVTGATALGNDLDGVVIQEAPGNTVGGTTPEARNVISGNGRRGVFVVLPAASGNEILGNYIGTDVNGTADLGNTQYGVFINSAPNNTIGGTTAGAGNVISGNEYGVLIFLPDATGNQVQGNLIGTDVTGATALGNDLDGVAIQQAPGNTVGGTIPEARNVISGNGRRGVLVFQPTASGNEILGNYIGTDANGTADLGNAHIGVTIFDATNNSIGGTTAGAGNVISGNSFGVFIGFGDATDNRVEGNLIGTDFTGTVALGNEFDGVVLDGGASNFIGGTASGSRNIISGNGDDGIDIRRTASGNLVLGNFIGTDISGTVILPNLEDGVQILDASNNSIGGFGVGEGNLIAGNGVTGVLITSPNAKGNAVLGNSIHSNAGLGLALETETVWINDPGDPDLGSNDFQNFPVLTSITVGAADTTVEGTLNSLPNQSFRLQFFSNTTCDASAHGEGESLLGFLDVTTDGSGNAAFAQSFPNTAPVSDLITATATAADNSTSEFSICGTDTESDGDTVSDLDDCDPGDNQVWTLPGAAVDLMLSHTGGPGGTTTLSWTVPTPIGGVTAVLVYDTISSVDPSDFVTSASCVESDDGSDTMAVHTTAPPAGTALQFLIRAENPCGDGSLGERSDGTARSARNCP